jgi:hypothetical protein
MKNKMVDVRTHLVAMMERLGDENLPSEKLDQTIEAAKATALVAGQYISAVKTEIEAVKIFAEIGKAPESVGLEDQGQGSGGLPARASRR